jgi:hypothetical protein
MAGNMRNSVPTIGHRRRCEREAFTWCCVGRLGVPVPSSKVQVLNPFASLVVYIQLRYPLRSVESSTQLHLIMRPDLDSPRQARSIELLGTTRIGS